MFVLRSSGPLVVLIVLVTTLIGCGGATTPGASGSVGTVSPGDTPPPTTEPDAGASVPVDNPPILDGTFSTGKIHVEVSGEVNKTFDFPLQAGGGFSGQGSTVLTYGESATGAAVVILSAETQGFTISSPEFSVGGSSGEGNNCTISVSQSDAARVAGTFDCKGAIGLAGDGAAMKQVTADLRGTFEASR
jgi:hypothetical protein